MFRELNRVTEFVEFLVRTNIKEKKKKKINQLLTRRTAVDKKAVTYVVTSIILYLLKPTYLTGRRGKYDWIVIARKKLSIVYENASKR